jgi:acetyl-CoA synthetase
MSANRIKSHNFFVNEPNQFIRDLFKTSGLEQFVNITVSSSEQIPKHYPSPEFSANARIKSLEEYKKLYKESIDNPNEFWDKIAKDDIVWDKPYDKVLEWEEPYSKWFQGGKLNVSYNCLDKHLLTEPDKVAILWEGEPESPENPAEVRRITYRELHEQVCKFANVLKKHGLQKGDRAVIYMPMVPETAVAMLACTRIGVIHSVIFAGFSAQAIADRTSDCEAKVIITIDGNYRRGKVVPLKGTVDDSLELCDDNGKIISSTVEKVLIYKHAGNEVTMKTDRDLWWHDEMKTVNADCPHELMDSEDLLFILYTSGSTGKPKGIKHTTAGYLLNTKLSHKYVFDIKDNDIYWCTADVGWITGHSYIVYGPLANGTTVFMYEGAPNFPDPGRFWKLIEKHKITIFYTAPTAIRSFMKWGDNWPNKFDLSSLRLLGTVGEPINPQAWRWYNKEIGNEKCPIVDTWWQTETGAMMITPLPGATPTKPGTATLPFFGIEPEIVNEKGQSVPQGSSGSLIIKKPWPSMLRGLWKDDDRYLTTYWTEYPGTYFTGDSARMDEDGYIWIIGREDDVINVSGHRIGTAEVESVLVAHDTVAEAAAVGIPDDIKGSLLVVFVTLMQGVENSEMLSDELKSHVSKVLGATIKPDEIRFVEGLPKTRSGKIMRRLLKQAAAGTEITGDVTTLEDLNVLSGIIGK